MAVDEPTQSLQEAESQDRSSESVNKIGARLRAEREHQRLSVRELSRRVGLSASLISQLERGLVRPSVSTLYAVVSELRLSLDELFAAERDPGGRPDAGAPAAAAAPAAVPVGSRGVSPPVQRAETRRSITLASGVRWERLTASADPHVEFLRAIYPVGAESCPPDALMRHGGKEYIYVEHGQLGITVGFETYQLAPGDSISFESAVPQRLFNADGTDEVVVITSVIGRHGDWRPEIRADQELSSPEG